MKHPLFSRKALVWAWLATAGIVGPAGAASTNSTQSTKASATSATNAPAILDAKAMARRVTDLNIFDPDRQPRVRGESRPAVKPKPVVPADAPELGLVGVMSFARGTFAFFDGNASEYRKTLESNAVIAGHTVSAIAPQSVTLSESNRPPIQLRVGQRLRKDSEGNWQLVSGAGGEGFARSVGSSGASNGGGANGSSAGATTTEDPPGSDEILKRLLKKREQEMK
jgi:hypothetical protein